MAACFHTALWLRPPVPQDMINSGRLSAASKPEGLSHHRHSAKAGRGSVRPCVLVLVPTRELAVQVGEQAARFGAPLGIPSV